MEQHRKKAECRQSEREDGKTMNIDVEIRRRLTIKPHINIGKLSVESGK